MNCYREINKSKISLSSGWRTCIFKDNILFIHMTFARKTQWTELPPESQQFLCLTPNFLLSYCVLKWGVLRLSHNVIHVLYCGFSVIKNWKYLIIKSFKKVILSNYKKSSNNLLFAYNLWEFITVTLFM